MSILKSLILVAFAASLQLANAASIPTLFNTGVHSTDNIHQAAGLPDSHYTLIFGDRLVPGAPAITYQNDAYVPNGPLSVWISRDSNGGSIFDELSDTVIDYFGATIFRTTFDLTGYNLLATTINIRCSADNVEGSVIKLNGVTLAGSCDDYDTIGINAFDVTEGFLQGINTLDFTVINDGGPYAFRAEYTSETELIVPEPATVAFVSFSLGGLALYRRRLNR